MIPPTGEQYEISGGGYTAVITQSGATLRALRRGDDELVAGFTEDAMPSSGAGQLLMPWPNRIRDGRYRVGERTLQLPLSEPARQNASHGLVRWSPWTVTEHSPARVTLALRLMAQSGYPWTLDLTVTYEVGEDGLRVTQSALNRSAEPAPYAAGAHPYLTLGDGSADDWELELPAARYVISDERMLPVETVPVAGTEFDFRTSRAIGPTVLDTCFGDLERGADGQVTVALSNGVRRVELWAEETTRWLMVFTGDTTATPRRSVAIEPMSAPVDAFNSGDDLTLLAPDASHALVWGLR